jgi:transposase
MGQAKSNRPPASTGALTTQERVELNRLRRDLKRVEMERDFLKKAAAFFA